MSLEFKTLTPAEALAFMLAGMMAKRAEIEETLRDLRSQLRTQSPQALADSALIAKHERENGRGPRRKMSAITRKRMAAAQKARWAKVKA